MQDPGTSHSSLVTAVAFSPDGKRIASGSDDGMIKLWDVVEFLETSLFPAYTPISRLKLCAGEEIEVSERVDKIKFSSDGQHLATNLGPIKLKKHVTGKRDSDFDSLDDLYVHNQWICYGTERVIRLPSDSESACYDTRDDQITIGFRDGRVLSFDFDRRRLHSELALTSDLAQTRHDDDV